jgi:acyl-CoA thioester hydrolase
MFMRTDADDIVATTELAIVNVHLVTRRAEPWTERQRATLAALASAHANLPVPPQAGRAIKRGDR